MKIQKLSAVASRSPLTAFALLLLCLRAGRMREWRRTRSHSWTTTEPATGAASSAVRSSAP